MLISMRGLIDTITLESVVILVEELCVGMLRM
jgi:hypothetical protein